MKPISIILRSLTNRFTPLAIMTYLALAGAATANDPMEDGFANPPLCARMRAYWWWANGNVNKAAITKDLEWMKRIGMGGALIFDAGTGPTGAVPQGPLFGSPPWRELFKYTLAEANRLGLEMTLSPQSGWNLGGPSIKPEQAAKHITWSETDLTGPAKFSSPLPMPKQKAGFYQDTHVLAYRVITATPRAAISASSTQKPEYAPDRMLDHDPKSFWVSGSQETLQGPSPTKPEWVQLTFPQPVAVSGAIIHGRADHGPKECEWQISSDGKSFITVKTCPGNAQGESLVHFPVVNARCFRLLITSAFDANRSQPRNVQIAEISLLDRDGHSLDTDGQSRPISQLALKAAYHEAGGSATSTTSLLDDVPPRDGEQEASAKDVIDLSDRLKDGKLIWNVPDGTWRVLRFGYTNTGAHVSTSSNQWTGLVVDYLDRSALESYWKQVVNPLIADAGPLAGKTLAGVQTDSWEAGGLNWSAGFEREFVARRGYDLKPYLPVVAGHIIGSRDVSNRFLADLRRTVADCMAENHYGVMAELAAKHDMFIHCEAGGPHAGPFDSLQNLGKCARPMGEFWVESPHRPTEDLRFFMKVAASAAHTYGRQIACGEGFTSVGPHWNDVLWSSQKPTFDHEACAGLNLTYWHAFTCSPPEMGVPGQEYFAGTHFDPQITWAKQAGAFVAYLNRCQFLLQQGKFVADVCSYYGNHVPNVVPRKQADPAKVLPTYDYDVCNEEVLLKRMSVKDGRITLPDGMSYRMLSLPDFKVISLPALRKIRELVRGGALVRGPKPERTCTLQGYPECDAELKRIADELWDSGRVSDKPSKDLLASVGLPPDFEADASAGLDFIHRRDGNADIYFVSNPKGQGLTVAPLFRVSGKQPEIWDPVNGTIRDAESFSIQGGRTTVPLELTPYGSTFVIFRKPAGKSERAGHNFPVLAVTGNLDGPWMVSFDPKWGGPGMVRFDSLTSWTERPEDGIKYYSGTATYRKTFDLREPTASSARNRLFLDLGTVREMAEVRLNGKNLGVVWCPPWHVEITSAVKPTGNELEIDVINNWPNRLIGDGRLPPQKRLTKTNVSVYYNPPKSGGQHKLFVSGLLGPVTVQSSRTPNIQ